MVQQILATIIPILPRAAIIIFIIAAQGSDNNFYYRFAALNGEGRNWQ